MKHVEKWCMICGRPCGECKHCEIEDRKTTDDAVQAMRIRQIYQGIEPDPDNRTHK